MARRIAGLGRHVQEFVNDLLNCPLVRPWRESLDLFREHYWQQVGLKLTGDSYDRVAAFIERRIRAARLMVPFKPTARPRR